MQLKSVRIQNFKAIKDCDFELTDATLLVGANNAGKSSILQAIHFASRTLAQASEANKQSTLSLSEMEYIPSTNYKELAHMGVWGNQAGSSESKVTFRFEDPIDNSKHEASVVLKSARNEGVSVDPKIPARLLALFRTKDAVFSAYIPGLAGIPVQEEVLAKRQIFRKAASGDSNVVLRNILLLTRKQNQLTQLLDFVHDVYPEASFDVSFDEERDYYVKSNITIEKFPFSSVKPLEFSGTGFLQVLQIFSYLVLFRPKIILIDEPESHLHPTLQTRLVRALQKRVGEMGAIALITSHSPFVARGLPLGSRTVWLSDGKVASTSNDEIIREALGWGALDKRILLCCEDGNISMLNNILAQVDSLHDKVSVFPFDGVSKMGTAKQLDTLRKKLGGRHKIVVHRDRDCMTDDELRSWRDEYQKFGIETWVTRGSDVEMYFCEEGYISSALGISAADAEELLKETEEANLDAYKSRFVNKRREINKRLYEKTGGSPDVEGLWASTPRNQRLVGKEFMSAIRDTLNSKDVDEKQVGKFKADFVVANDAVDKLVALIGSQTS